MMGLARRKEDMGGFPIKEDARRRIDTARMRQLAFEIRAGRNLSISDAEMLASVLLDLADHDESLNFQTVRQGLIKRGRSPHAADQLLKSIGSL